MTTIQKRELVRKALRNARRFYRSADSSGEILERNLDRLIKRKTLVTREQLAPLVTQYQAWGEKLRTVEGGITALLEVSAI